MVFAVLGLMLATALVAWYGFGKVVGAALSAGAGGFALLSAWQVLLFVAMGIAWSAVALPRGGPRPATFVWGRMVRDSASACLPFSQVGGFVLGARAVTLHGVSWATATMSTVVDLCAEFLSEIAFAGIGVVVLLSRSTDRSLAVPAAIGLGLAVLAGFAVIRLQPGIGALFARFGKRIVGDSAGKDLSELQLAAAYGGPARLAIGTALHLVGWLGKGVGNWIAFRLLGADIDLLGACAIEALLHAVLSFAVVVPGYAGVQEAGYAGLGALFGVPADLSSGVSLLRRARDLAVGIPILLVWQLVELKRLPARG